MQSFDNLAYKYFDQKRLIDMSIRKTIKSPYFRFNKPITQDQPNLSNANSKFNDSSARSLDARKPKQTPNSVSCQKVESRTFQENQIKKFVNKMAEGNQPSRNLRFQIKCTSEACEKQDVGSVYSYGGYSVKSKIAGKNLGTHNHKKLKYHTVYDFAQNDLPYVFKQLHQKSNMAKQEQIDESSQKKQIRADWRASQFVPIFVSKNDSILARQNQVKYQEGRQKQEIQKYQKGKQKQKNYQSKIRKELKRTNFMNNNGQKSQPREGSQRNTGIYVRNDSMVKIKEGRQGNMRTRLQQKEEQLDGFQVSQMPQPGHAAMYCYPCHSKYQDYFKHIQTPQHKLKLRSLGTQYFQDEVIKFSTQKVEQLDSIQFRNIQQLATYLENIADSIDMFILKKNAQLKAKTVHIQEQINKLSCE